MTAIDMIARPITARLQIQSAEPRVRAAEVADRPALHRLYTQPHIVAGTSAPAHGSLAQTTAWAEGVSAHGYLLVATAGEALVGALALKTCDDPLRRHTAEICRVAVDAGWQGRGVGSRLVRAAVELADEWLNVQRLELLVRADNAAAQALYRKHGFVEEGLLRGYGFRAGEYVDIVAMARLRGPIAQV